MNAHAAAGFVGGVLVCLAASILLALTRDVGRTLHGVADLFALRVGESTPLVERTEAYTYTHRRGTVLIEIHTPPLTPDQTREEWETRVNLYVSAARQRLLDAWEDAHE